MTAPGRKATLYRTGQPRTSGARYRTQLHPAGRRPRSGYQEAIHVIGQVAARQGRRLASDGRRLRPSVPPVAGFLSATYYCDDEAGFAGSLTVWEAKEAAEAAATAANEKTREVMGSRYRERPTVQVLQVYEPAG